MRCFQFVGICLNKIYVDVFNYFNISIFYIFNLFNHETFFIIMKERHIETLLRNATGKSFRSRNCSVVIGFKDIFLYAPLGLNGLFEDGTSFSDAINFCCLHEKGTSLQAHQPGTSQTSLSKLKSKKNWHGISKLAEIFHFSGFLATRVFFLTSNMYENEISFLAGRYFPEDYRLDY